MNFMKPRPGAIWAIATLFLVSLACVSLRTLWSREGGVPLGDRIWKLTLDYDFRTEHNGAYLYLALPVETPHVSVVGQNYFHPGLYQARLKEKTGEPREAVFYAPQRGWFNFQADFQLHYTPGTHRQRGEPQKTVLTADERDLYLSAGPEIQIGSEPIQTLVHQLSAVYTDKDKLLEAIVEFCEKKIAANTTGAPSDAAGGLEQKKATTVGRARLMIALCRAGKIPARLITGFVLNDDPAAEPHYWVEVYVNDRWLPFDPENGHRRDLPAHFVPVRRGEFQILRIKDISDLFKRYSISHIAMPQGILGGRELNVLEIVDLTRLPLSTQNSLIILLMLPIGALLTTFFRNVIGVMTFGTFTPTLLALATVYADWRTAVILFIVVVVIGIGGRALLPGLKLMRVPRLSVVFTLVAFIMALTLSTLDHFNFSPAGHVVLLPLVVLTTIIDRVYTIADEDGMRIALLRLFWTIVVAVSCIVIFRWQAFARLLLIYPELHFSTLALLLLLGLYNARRLTDISSFHFLTEDRKKKKKVRPDDAGEAD